MNEQKVAYLDAGASWRERVAAHWGAVAAAHMHVGDDGFSLLAVCGEQVVGLLSAKWRRFPIPGRRVLEAYIDIIEVRRDHQRRGIARELVSRAADRSREQGAYQLRAWSSQDKRAAILMWKALGFGLYPAVTYPGGEAVRGYFVTRALGRGAL